MLTITENSAIDKLFSNQPKSDASPNPPRTRPKIPDSKLLPFAELIEREFIEGSAIAPDLFKTAVGFIEDSGRWETYRR